MIRCSVCLAENDDFAITCKKCKAFLQNRVPNLDLFETAWRILESPRATFQQIVLADHKNYSLFLFSLFGISLSFTAFWYFKLGSRYDTLLDLVPWAIVVGIALGVVSAIILTLAYHLVAKLLGGAAAVRDSLALLAYSLTPIAVSLFIVLPIELLTFGMYLFTSNPHPYTIKPVSYVILVGFDVIVSLWSLGLAILATKVGHRISTAKSLVVTVAALALFGAVILFAAGKLHLIDQA